MKPAFLIHKDGDHVGVAVLDLEPDQQVTGVTMDTNRQVQVYLSDPVPLGHKIALADLDQESRVIEYGLPIGIATKPITTGQHVHTQNIRSARW